jgi:hypothetical protein
MKSPWYYVGIIFFCGSLVSLAAAGLIVAGQVLFWLKFGVWNPVTVTDVSNSLGIPIFHPHQDNMVGLQIIIDSVVQTTYRLPGSVFFFLLSIAFLILLKGIESEIERRPNSN